MAVEVIDREPLSLGAPVKLMEGIFSLPVLDAVRFAPYGVGANGQASSYPDLRKEAPLPVALC